MTTTSLLDAIESGEVYNGILDDLEDSINYDNAIWYAIGDVLDDKLGEIPTDLKNNIIFDIITAIENLEEEIYGD